uniref:C-type lectin domain-containing protein n=1 Tax=Macrostomum lignano TaxID=282301 RepID=A0A1I8JNG3_9PLAT
TDARLSGLSQSVPRFRSCSASFRQRLTDSVNFSRPWPDYVSGFGDEDNFWIAPIRTSPEILWDSAEAKSSQQWTGTMNNFGGSCSLIYHGAAGWWFRGCSNVDGAAKTSDPDEVSCTATSAMLKRKMHPGLAEALRRVPL